MRKISLSSFRSAATVSVGLTIGAWGLFQVCRIHFVNERSWVLGAIRPPTSVRPDGIFAGLLADLRREDSRRSVPLGFTSDLAEGAERGERYQRARYALLPHSLLPSPSSDLVVAWLGNPANLPSVCARDGLVPVHVYQPGVALLRRQVQ